MIKISICDKCKYFKHKEVMKEIDANFKNIKYDIGCNNMCGVGMNKYVVILNDRPIIAGTLDELIKKMREII